MDRAPQCQFGIPLPSSAPGNISVSRNPLRPITDLLFAEVHVALLNWNHACTVGVAAMDAQHGILMDAMNDLGLAIARGAGRDKTTELLNRLLAFSRMHFTSEEQLMEHYAFPGLDEHRAEHRRLLARLLESAGSMERGERVAMRPLLGFLREWFTGHIRRFDHRYGTWLNERGVY